MRRSIWVQIKALDDMLWKAFSRVEPAPENSVTIQGLLHILTLTFKTARLHFKLAINSPPVFFLQTSYQSFFTAVKKVQAAKKLCSAEDERMFAAISLKRICSALQGCKVTPTF